MQANGIIVPLITPITDDMAIDNKGLRHLIDLMAQSGVDGIFVAGTTGEYCRLHTKQRHQLFSLATEFCNGRMAVYAGVTDAGFPMVEEHISAAHAAGVDFCVAGLPYYFPVHTNEEALEWFSRILERSHIPVVLYDIPGNVGASISPLVVSKLANDIAGLKDSSGCSDKMSAYLNSLGGDNRRAAYLCGCEALTKQAVTLKSDGLVPSLGNVLPSLLTLLWSNRMNPVLLDKLTQIMNEVISLNNCFSGSVGHIAWKKRVLSIMGICGDAVTCPSSPIADTENNRLMSIVNRAADAVSQLKHLGSA